MLTADQMAEIRERCGDFKSYSPLATRDIRALLTALEESIADKKEAQNIARCSMDRETKLLKMLAKAKELYKGWRERCKNAEAERDELKYFDRLCIEFAKETTGNEPNIHGVTTINVHTLKAFGDDRDRWKARCEAMEMAIKRHNSNIDCHTCNKEGCHGCICDSNWVFDEARFAGEGEKVK